jgi:general secretion pathway protein F
MRDQEDRPMPSYRFSVIDAEGTRTSGERAAADPGTLAADLEAEGWTVLDVGPAGVVNSDAPLNDRDARAFVDQLSNLTRSGLPLPPGLRALAEELPRGRLRRLVRDLASRLESGESLAEALEAERGRFPEHLRGLMLAAVKSGQVGQVLGEFAGYAQVGAALRRTLILSLAYPLMLLVAFTILVVFIATYIVAGFREIFLDFGINLPLATRYLIRASDAVAKHGFQLVAAPFLVAAVAWTSSRMLLDRVSRRRLFCRVPLIGGLWRLTALAEFAHFLGLLVENRVPLDDAIPLAAEGAHDAELQDAGQRMAEEIRAGASLSQAARRSDTLPTGFSKVLSWAEGHQSLPETLHMAGEIFEAHARTRASFVASVVTVLTIISILWGCAFMVGALFLPLIQLISKLSG